MVKRAAYSVMAAVTLRNTEGNPTNMKNIDKLTAGVERLTAQASRMEDRIQAAKDDGTHTPAEIASAEYALRRVIGRRDHMARILDRLVERTA